MVSKIDLKRILSGESPKPERKKPVDKLVVKSREEGKNIWFDSDVMNFFETISMQWEKENEVAVFLPCSATKPYYVSPSHTKGYLSALYEYIDLIDLFVISEPMGVVPYEHSDRYPVDSYDYNPYEFMIGKLRDPLVTESVNTFIQRVTRWLEKYDRIYDKKVIILPKSWHLKIFQRSMRNAKADERSYKVINLKRRPQTSLCRDYIKKQLEELEWFH